MLDNAPRTRQPTEAVEVAVPGRRRVGRPTGRAPTASARACARRGQHRPAGRTGRRRRARSPTPGAAPRRWPGCRRRPGPTVLERAAAAAAAQRRDELARLLALELGKPVKDGRGEIDRVADTFAVCAAEARRIGGEVLPVAGWARGVGNTALTYRAPVGVALAITPFNAPANLLAHKLGAVVRGRQHDDRQAAAAGAGRRPPPWSRCCSRRACRRRRCSCCTAAARSAPRCAPRRRSASSASPAARPPARRWPARPAPSGWCWSSAATPPRSSARTPTSPPPRGSAPRTGYSNSGQSCISVQRVYVHRARFDEFVDAFTARGGEARRSATRSTRRPTSARWSTTTPPSGWSRWAAEAAAAGATDHDRRRPRRRHRRARPSWRRPAAGRPAWSATRCSAPLVSVLPYDDFDDVVGGLQRQPLRAAGRPVHPRHPPDPHRLARARGRRPRRQRLVELPARPRAVRRGQGLRLRARVAALDDRGLHRRQDAAAARHVPVRRSGRHAMSVDELVDTGTRDDTVRRRGHGGPARVVRRRVRLRHLRAHQHRAAGRAGPQQHPSSSSPGTSRPRRTPPTATPAPPASPASCCCTSGPGMTNAVTGVLTAALDSVPLVAITGDIPSYYYGRHPHQEVNLHADADQTAIYRPFVKRAWQVHRVEDLPRFTERAFWTATSGRPGAVLLNVPMDHFSRPVPRGHRDRATRSPAPAAARRCRPTSPTGSPTCSSAAERPLVYLGGGLRRGAGPRRAARAGRAPRHPGRALADGQGHAARQPPARCSACPASGAWRLTNALHPRGRRRAGRRPPGSPRPTPARGTAATPGSSRPAGSIQIDIDPAEIGRNYPVEIGAVADVADAVQAIAAAVRAPAARRRRRGRRCASAITAARARAVRRQRANAARSDAVPAAARADPRRPAGGPAGRRGPRHRRRLEQERRRPVLRAARRGPVHHPGRRLDDGLRPGRGASASRSPSRTGSSSRSSATAA